MDVIDMPLIPAVELIYRELARPRSPDPTPAHAKLAATKAELTRDDINEILMRRRGGSASELEQIINNAKQYNLTPGEKNQLSVDLTIQVAHARQSNGKRDNPSERFIAQVLGLVETPQGLIAREWVDGLLRDGARNIARCKRHQPPCECWSSQRAILWQARANGEKTPEAWAASRIYQALEDLELSSR